jgi:hypothetical protein
MSAHEQFAEDLALYALGVLEGPEKETLLQHLGVSILPSTLQRGKEKKQRVLAYVRIYPEELRPISPSVLRD